MEVVVPKSDIFGLTFGSRFDSLAIFKLRLDSCVQETHPKEFLYCQAHQLYTF